MSKRVLMVAFQFPPFQGSSGIQRTLSYCRYLPESDWQPLVLAPTARAYPHRSDDLMSRVPQDLIVKKTFSLDAARDLSIAGRYLRWSAIPDQWASWWFSAVPAGLRMIKQYRPQAIWSTYPTSSAHMIAMTLQRMSGLPWIADFRDPMVYESFPTEPLTRRSRSWLERKTLQHCAKAVFVTPSAQALYRERYPQLPDTRFALISNGYDEESFSSLPDAAPTPADASKPLLLVHSGLLEPQDRDPEPFFTALAGLFERGEIQRGKLKIILRASGSESLYHEQIKARGLSDVVTLEPRCAYQQALKEMLSADGLLVFQGPDCNRQIPGKIYEYIRARKPMLSLVDMRGDTAQLLKTLGIDTNARIDDTDDIARALGRFVKLLKQGQAPVASEEDVLRYSRHQKAIELAQLLDSVT
ncbi:MAG: glycosyltransferase family 4 protein [Gammaproteobacteria bacterium]|nr:glycosyltransferase family 4 protein [Gammaproteobacteria bacterium]